MDGNSLGGIDGKKEGNTDGMHVGSVVGPTDGELVKFWQVTVGNKLCNNAAIAMNK